MEQRDARHQANALMVQIWSARAVHALAFIHNIGKIYKKCSGISPYLVTAINIKQ